MERSQLIGWFCHGVGIAAVASMLVVGAAPAVQAAPITFQLVDGSASTIAQQERFLPITAYGFTTDRAIIQFYNGTLTKDLIVGERQLIVVMDLWLWLVTGNLPAEATGDRQATHDFVYSNTITVNGVTQSFAQSAHADFALWSTTNTSMLLELSAVPLLVFDLGPAGRLELEIVAATIRTTGYSFAGSIGSMVYATLREPGPVTVPEPATLALFACGLNGVMARRFARRR